MRMILDEYADIIERYTIDQWNVEPGSSRFKAEIQFTNNSILMVKDYLFPTGRKYSYHWQDSDGNLIARWDNAPHWIDIDTFPYHRHEGDSLFPSVEMTLDKVMEYISIHLKKSDSFEIAP